MGSFTFSRHVPLEKGDARHKDRSDQGTLTEFTPRFDPESILWITHYPVVNLTYVDYILCLAVKG